jgi:hypothetical protein
MLREAVRLPAYASRAITQRSATDGIAKALSRRLLGHAEHGRDPMHRNGVGIAEDSRSISQQPSGCVAARPFTCQWPSPLVTTRSRPPRSPYARCGAATLRSEAKTEKACFIVSRRG